MKNDIVIVGGGSTGAVLAHRLSQAPSRRVVLLEAAPDRVGGDARHDWGYVSEAGAIFATNLTTIMAAEHITARVAAWS